MRARRWWAAVLLGLATSGCGDQVVAVTAEAKFTKRNAERFLERGTDGTGLEGPGRPVSSDLERIECSGGEDANRRGDFTCTAVSETGWKIRCEGQVTDRKVPSGGCHFLGRD